jgi:8-oxo-(d)GTP phosphatase
MDGVIRAAGAVLWRPDGHGHSVAVVHRPRYDDWSLPKGKLDAGETGMAAAVREVREETGYHARLGRRLGQASYVVQSPLARRTGPKIVDYWAALAVDGRFAPNAEVDRLRWLSPHDAAEVLTHDLDRDVLESFTTVPVPTSTVVLVRHAKAGMRSRWRGDDRLRPLSPAGRRQAAELLPQLRLFGPTRVHSAEPVRCVDTVLALARELGTEVVREPTLGDEAYLRDPRAGLRRLLELAQGDEVVVVCSQGQVIPGLVRELAGPAAAEDDGTVPSKKASTWVLSMCDDKLIAADHYPPP